MPTRQKLLFCTTCILVLVGVVLSIYLVKKNGANENGTSVIPETEREINAAPPSDTSVVQESPKEYHTPVDGKVQLTEFFPEQGLWDVEDFLGKKANETLELIEFENHMRKIVADGWRPPWHKMAPDFTAEECSKMTTSELSEAFFSTSIFARETLIVNNPEHSFIRMKILFPCFNELYHRDDLCDGVLDAYYLHSSILTPEADPNDIVSGFVGLKTLPKTFELPSMRQQMVGRELSFVRAQLDALKIIRSYIENDPDNDLISSTPYFDLSTPISLIDYSLYFMNRHSPSDSASAINEMSKLKIEKTPTMGEVKKFMDVSITEIEKYLIENES